MEAFWCASFVKIIFRMKTSSHKDRKFLALKIYVQMKKRTSVSENHIYIQAWTSRKNFYMSVKSKLYYNMSNLYIVF